MKIISITSGMRTYISRNFWTSIILGVVMLVALQFLLIPRFSVESVMQNVTTLPNALPVLTWDVSGPITATMRVHRFPWQRTDFLVIPDDCTELLTVDERVIVKQVCKNGMSDKRFLIDVGPARTASIVAKVRNGKNSPMGFTIQMPEDAIELLMLRIAFALLLATALARIIRLWLGITDSVTLFMIGAGILTRYLYGTYTDFNIRAYDALHHLYYVYLMVDHWQIPAAGGWETHQPPLYYALTSLIVRAAQGTGIVNAVSAVQAFSIFLSIGALFVGLWIGSRVLRKQGTIAMRMYAMFLAGLPGIIFFAPRISNDVLVTFEVFVSGALMLVWWKSGSRSAWYGLWLLAAAGFLTKLNGASIAITLFLIGILAPRSIRPTMRTWVGSLILFTLLTAWLPVIRFHEGPNSVRNLVMTGKAGITPALKVRHDPADFLTFNPIGMLLHPVNEPYNDASRRSKPFEYFFRSALFGEFSDQPVPWLSHTLLLLALSLIPWMIFGVVKQGRNLTKEYLPFVVLSVVTIALWLTYIIIFPYSPEQDFRFSGFLVCAGAALLAAGVQGSSEKWKKNGELLTLCFSTLSMLMLIL